jgi:hypothetical protein
MVRSVYAEKPLTPLASVDNVAVLSASSSSSEFSF